MFSMLQSRSSHDRGLDFKCRGADGRLPVGRKQDGKVVLVGHGWEAFEDVGEVGLGVVTVAAGAFDEGVDDGAALAGGLAAHEEPVLFADGGGPDAVLDPVVVDLKTAVLDVDVEPFPDGEGVVDGTTKFALGQDLRVLAQGDELGFEDLQEGHGVFAADAFPLCGIGLCFPKPGFDLIELLDGGEGAGSEGLADLEGFVEFSPGVRPAGDKNDTCFVRYPRVVAGVGVGLQKSLVVSKQIVEAGGLATGVPLVEDVALDSVSRGVDDPEVSGGAFSPAGVEVFDRGFVGLEVAALQALAVDEFVEGLDDVGGLGSAEGSLFEALGMHPEAGAVPVEEFEEIVGTIDEDEDSTAAGIVAEARDDFGVQAVEGFPHVAGCEGEEDAQAAGKCQHGRRRVLSSSTASGRAAREPISNIAPQGRTIRSPPAGGAGSRPLSNTSANPGPSTSDGLEFWRRFRIQAMKVW